MGKKLHLRNLPSSATEQDLLTKFSRYGTVRTAMIMRDPDTGNSRGIGYVEMANTAEADTAISWLNFSQYDGLIMNVSEA